jgi:hypothetical protein
MASMGTIGNHAAESGISKPRHPGGWQGGVVRPWRFGRE